MRTEPKNETFLAAELASIGVHPVKAAIAAHDLCKMGRRYKRLAERLCGGEEEWGPQPRADYLIARAEKAKVKLRERICQRLEDCWFDHVQKARSPTLTGDSLILSVQSGTYTTALL